MDTDEFQRERQLWGAPACSVLVIAFCDHELLICGAFAEARSAECLASTLQARCQVEHVGLVLSGRATVAFDAGTVFELRPGALFYIPARPHDSWVVGEEPYVSLHFLGADHYAAPTTGVDCVGNS